MTRYRVVFDRQWIMGRWGFTDRVFYTLGGVEAEPKGASYAWEVTFKGKPRELGLLLLQRLHIDSTDQSQFATIFEITEVGQRAAR